jgi:hypothetical protein
MTHTLKKLSLMIIVFSLILPSYSFAGDESDEQKILEFFSEEASRALSERDHFLRGVDLLVEDPSGTIQKQMVRFRGPWFNIYLNAIRNALDEGVDISVYENTLLHVTEINGVKTNMMLSADFERNENGDIRLVLRETYRYDNGLEGWRYFLYNQGLGIVDLLVENVFGYTDMSINMILIHPFLELKNSVKSDSVGTRFKNSGLAVWESFLGIPSAFLDIFEQATEGDPMGSLSAVVRIPVSALQFGNMTVNKTLRLPVDGVMSVVNTAKSDEDEQVEPEGD